MYFVLFLTASLVLSMGTHSFAIFSPTLVSNSSQSIMNKSSSAESIFERAVFALKAFCVWLTLTGKNAFT